MGRQTEVFEEFVDRLTERFREPRRSWLFLFALLLIATAVFTFFLTADIDLFTRVAVGRLVQLNHAVPDQDPFVFTPKKLRWHDHEWLAGVLFYASARAGGDLALFVLKLLFLAGTLVAVRKAQDTLHGFRSESLLLTFLILPHLLNIWLPTIRAQSFTYLCYALFLLAFIQFRRKRWPLLFLALPLITVVWVNSHGGFVVGLAFLAFFAAAITIDSPRRAWLAWLVAALSAAAAFMNPYGYSFLTFIFEAVTNPPVIIDEWGPVGVFSGHSLLMLFFLAALIAGWRRGLKLPLEAYPILLVTLFESALHKRFVAFFSIAAAIYLPAHMAALLSLLERVRGEWRPKLRRSLVLLIVVLTIGSVVRLGCFFAVHRPFSLSYARYPVAALEWLRTHRSGGNVLLHYNEGSYALWRIYPRFKISLDGRYDGVFSMETIEMALGALDVTHPRQQEFFERINPDFVLVNAQSAEFEGRVALFPGFGLVYQDPQFSILEKGGRQTVLATGLDSPLPYIWEPLY